MSGLTALSRKSRDHQDVHLGVESNRTFAAKPPRSEKQFLKSCFGLNLPYDRRAAPVCGRCPGDRRAPSSRSGGTSPCPLRRAAATRADGASLSAHAHLERFGGLTWL